MTALKRRRRPPSRSTGRVGRGHRRAGAARPRALPGAAATAGAEVVVADLDGAACRAPGRGAEPRFGRRAPRPRRSTSPGPSRVDGRCATRCWPATGRIDVLVNNAAVERRRSTDGRATAEAPALRELPARALAARRWRERDRHVPLLPGPGQRDGPPGRGSIINIASTYGAGGARPAPLPAARRPQGSASRRPTRPPRAAVLALHPLPGRVLGRAPGVRVNALSPGRRRRTARTRTSSRSYSERTPLGRMAGAARATRARSCSWPATRPAT